MCAYGCAFGGLLPIATVLSLLKLGKFAFNVLPTDAIEFQNLAPAHIETRFLKMNVDNAPFLVTKLKVQVLPCVIAFVDGVGADRVVGFEGLAGSGSGSVDDFRTKDLETRLLAAGVLVQGKKFKEAEVRRFRVRGINKARDDDDDGDDDWD